jgi:hypothetical protein
MVAIKLFISKPLPAHHISIIPSAAEIHVCSASLLLPIKRGIKATEHVVIKLKAKITFNKDLFMAESSAALFDGVERGKSYTNQYSQADIAKAHDNAVNPHGAIVEHDVRSASDSCV